MQTTKRLAPKEMTHSFLPSSKYYRCLSYIADTNGNSMRAYNTVTAEVTTFAGNGVQGYVDGIGTQAQIHRPRGLTSDGSSLYWAEFNQHTIRQGVLATQEVSFPQFCPGFLDGTGAGLQNTLFDLPFSVAFHFPSNSLFVVDGVTL